MYRLIDGKIYQDVGDVDSLKFWSAESFPEMVDKFEFLQQVLAMGIKVPGPVWAEFTVDETGKPTSVQFHAEETFQEGSNLLVFVPKIQYTV